MAPASLWAALAVGLQLWTSARAVPAQVALDAPYAPEPGGSCQEREYLDKNTQMCCRKCPPGQHVKHFCTENSDTVCEPCQGSTYTQLWNWLPECLSCSSRCTSDQVETQACTREQNRICSCRPGSYCVLGRQEGCRLCGPLRKCPPGTGVVKQGTTTSDVVCAPCSPGTFSSTLSSTEPCRPHRSCSSVAVPGNASRDAVCGWASLPSTLRVTSGPTSAPPPESTASPPREPTLGPSLAAGTSLLLPTGHSPPVEGVGTGTISLPIGLIVGVTVVCLFLLMLVNCVFLIQKQKKPFCLRGEAKVPHLPPDKAGGAPGLEQQHLLTTAPSSSSSSLESAATGADKSQVQALGGDKCAGPGGARASAGGSEASSGSHGTQVNVTCIVNVCSGSDHGSQCPSQAGSTAGDTDASPTGSWPDEQVPFSKEECAFRSQRGAPETLLQDLEEKPLPLGVPDAGMKPS